MTEKDLIARAELQAIETLDATASGPARPVMAKPTIKEKAATVETTKTATKKLSASKTTTNASKPAATKIVPPPPPGKISNPMNIAWQKINSWGLGISGKVILLLIAVGIISELIKKL
jgi:hypothetical protein